jgi:predicted membrane metal-binding protein
VPLSDSGSATQLRRQNLIPNPEALRHAPIWMRHAGAAYPFSLLYSLIFSFLIKDLKNRTKME